MKNLWTVSVLVLLAANLGIDAATQDLLKADSWKCLDGVTFSGGNLTIKSRSRAIIPCLPDNGSGKPDKSAIPERQPLVNLFGQRYKVTDSDFTLTYTQNLFKEVPYKGTQYEVELTSGRVPMLNIYGTNVPFVMDEMYIDSPHIGIGACSRSGNLLVYIWDGKKYQPAQKKTFKIPSTRTIRVEFTRSGDTYTFKVNGQKVGTITYSDLFKKGNSLYFGTDIPHGSKMDFSEFTIDGGITQLPHPPPMLVKTPKIPVPPNSLRALASKHDLHVGTAVAVNQLFSDYEPIYAKTLAHSFNMITPENAMKFQFIHPEPDVYTFCEADGLVKWAEDNSMDFHAHTLVWDEAIPWWVFEGKYSASKLKSILKDHITTVAGRYRGRVQEWDVLNEPMHDDTDKKIPRHSIWYDNAFDKDIDAYFSNVFNWAKAADPKALLGVNEFGVETSCPKADALFDIVKKQIEKGTPIDFIGLQNHWASEDSLPSVKELLSQMTRYNEIGVHVRISELDKDISKTDKKSLDLQAQFFVNVLQACLAARDQTDVTKPSKTKGRMQGTCIGYSTWGFTDKYGSLGGGYGVNNIGHGLLMDQNYNPKPGYNSVVSYLRQTPKNKKGKKDKGKKDRGKKIKP